MLGYALESQILGILCFVALVQMMEARKRDR